MPFREFDDAAGVRWVVWSTVPTNGVALSSGMETGWLTLESSTERRRIAPIPEGWATASDARLEQLLKVAAQVPRTDPIVGVASRVGKPLRNGTA
jgi:hypothetical protein